MLNTTNGRELARRFGCDNCEQVTLSEAVDGVIRSASNDGYQPARRLLARMERSPRFRKRVENRVRKLARKRGFGIGKRNASMELDWEALKDFIKFIVEDILPLLIKLFK